MPIYRLKIIYPSFREEHAETIKESLEVIVLVFIIEHENEVQPHLELDVWLREEVIIRDARPEDALAVHLVLRNAFKPLISRGYSKTAAKCAIIEPWMIRKRIISGWAVLVAEHETEIIGTITGIEERRTMQAVSFAVHPLYQGHGIGKELLKALESLAVENDCHKIYALTAWPMIEAARLYLHLDYVQEGYLRHHYHGEDLIVFSKYFSQEDVIQWSSSNPKCEAIRYSWPYWLF
jgi:N-acetylglutamate synthase-like GNAT family acetyltransferase